MTVAAATPFRKTTRRVNEPSDEQRTFFSVLIELKKTTKYLRANYTN